MVFYWVCGRPLTAAQLTSSFNLLCSNLCYRICGKKIFSNWTIYFVTCNCLFLLVVWRQKLFCFCGFPKNRLIAKTFFPLWQFYLVLLLCSRSCIKQKPFELIKFLFNQDTFFIFTTLLCLNVILDFFSSIKDTKLFFLNCGIQSYENDFMPPPFTLIFLTLILVDDVLRRTKSSDQQPAMNKTSKDKFFLLNTSAYFLFHFMLF